jgi:diguanylate cyclase
VTASFGVALTNTPPAPADLDGLVDRADRALYAAKRAGRNRVRTEGDAVEAVPGLERPAPRQAIPR